MQQSRVLVFFAISVLFTAVYSQAKEGSGSTLDQEIVSDMKIEMLNDKFKQNGHKILCEQRSYVRCYDLSEEQCSADIASVNDSCIKYTNKKIKEISNIEERPRKMGKIYSTCLMMKHISLHSTKMETIKKCLKTVKIDKEKIKKSLME